MKNSSVLTQCLLIVLTAVACNNNDNSDSAISPDNHEVTAQVNGSVWSGKGSYSIAFGNNPQLFILTGRNDTSQFSLEFRASGPGQYKVIENGYYFSVRQKIIYDITFANVTISKVTIESLASGNFEFEAIAEGRKVKIKEGKFIKVKGEGYW